MLTVYCPSDHFPEREYIIDELINSFLGIEYTLKKTHGAAEYKITLENRNSLTIRDQFFSRFTNELDYVKEIHIPKKITFINDRFSNEREIPLIFGRDALVEEQGPEGDIRIRSEADLFASSFFMLTRWEEYAIREKDPLGRFPAEKSLARKHEFLKIPVVNLYARYLWRIIEYLGFEGPVPERRFNALITHDVDYILKWNTLYGSLKALGADLVKRKDPGLFLINLWDCIRSRTGGKRDPFDTFSETMTLSEQKGLVSHFFFMSVLNQKKRHHFDIGQSFVKQLMREIHRRGHEIGFHPDFDTYLDKEKWGEEYDQLASVSPLPVRSGRQHFLQFQSPHTWQIWDEWDMDWDSSLAYDDVTGFRCGTCYPFHVFNFLSRKKLKLKEKPLIVMDKALITEYKDQSPEVLLKQAKRLVDEVNRHRGEFVLLWHNSSFHTKEWKPYQQVYSGLLEYISTLL